MKRKGNIGLIFLLLCTLTGCVGIEYRPAADLPEEVTEAWIGEVQEERESAENTMETVADSVTETVMIPEEDVATVSGPQATEVPLPTPVQEPEHYEFTESEKEYFSDALFIGDSRTVGLRIYGSLDNADYFASPGLSLYTIPKTKVSTGEYEDITLEELLEKEDYKKIYLMLGINELGYNFDTTVEKYKTLVEELRTKEPEAVLYVCANLHVTSVRDEHDEIHNNENINRINAEIEALSDDKDIFYLDVNALFDDEAGNLNEEFASDDSHVLGEYYNDWCDWLGENTIIK